MIHIVQAGDTLFQLSKKYGLSIDSLKTANQLQYNGLWIGQKLIIPIAANNGDNNNGSTNTSTSSLKTYTVQRGDSLYKIARKFGMTVAEIKRINNLSSNILSIGQKLKVPDPNATSNSSSSNSSDSSDSSDSNWGSWEDSNSTSGNSNSSFGLYVVQRGDSLYKIATQFKITTDYLKQINRLSSNTLYIGQQLKVPNAGGGNTSTSDSNDSDGDLIFYTVKAGDSLYQIAWIHKTSVESIKQLNGLKSSALNIGQRLKIKDGRQGGGNDSPIDISDNDPSIPNTDVEYEYYRVQSGDSLWSIAQLFNTTTTELKALNQLFNNSLSVGQLLKVGKKTTTSSPNTDIEVETGLSFDYQITIQDAVGACDQNYAEDVRKVQERLLQLGFLSQTAFDAEQSPFSSTRISKWQLTETIEAIKTFQKEVIQTNKIDGCISPEHESLMFLNSAVAPISATRLQQVKAAYTIFNFKSTDGKEIIGSLQKSVGSTNFGNLKEDVVKLQKRLVALGDLSKWHGETPTSSSIAPSKIHHTVTALKRFQEKRVAYWQGKTGRIGKAANYYKYGIASPKDLTHYLLQNYTDYRITFPLPNNLAKRDFAEFHDFVKASFTADVTGIAYFGKVKAAKIGLWEYRKLGLNNTQAKALQYVSEHEGNFDAINSYDKALFSWGFIQFAGGNGGLVSMLGMMKHLQPDIFKKYFQDFGIDVEYSIHTVRKDIRRANLVIFDRFSGKMYRGLPAEKYLKNNKLLFGVFIRAAYDKNVQLAQIRAAKDKYVIPAINIKLDIRVPVVQKLSSNKRSVTRTYIGPAAANYKTKWEYRSLKQKGQIRESVIDFKSMPITKVIRSEMGITVLIDLTVNQWIHKTRDLFMNAVYKIAMQDHLSTLAQISNVNELKVLKEMETKAEPKLKYRIQNIRMNSGLSAAK